MNRRHGDPTAFLFDEPLSNLDAALRVEMRYEIAKLHQTLDATMVYVTHDQVEAMTLADRIVVLQGGWIEQVGTPRELYERPANRFVAQFIGSPKMNVIPCVAGQGRYRIEGAEERGGGPERPAVELGIRPEAITLVEPGAGTLDGVVDVVEYLGADSFLIVDVGAAGKLVVRTGGDARFAPGTRVGLAFDADRVLFFDDERRTVADGS